jgi:hypothetical protein
VVVDMDLSHICKIKVNYPYFIQHQVSGIQYLAAYGANVNFKDFSFLVPACLG